MISTTNYVARKYGVRSAMPGFIGKKLCPELIFVKGHYEKYGIVAEQIRSIIREYDPNFSSHSLDEVYLDLTDAAIEKISNSSRIQKSLDSTIGSSSGSLDDATKCGTANTNVIIGLGNKLSPVPPNSKIDTVVSNKTAKNAISMSTLRVAACEVLQEIRQRVATDTGGLTCSAGIANNFLLAKVCADVNKPDGQYELPANKKGRGELFYHVVLYSILLSRVVLYCIVSYCIVFYCICTASYHVLLDCIISYYAIQM